jgi:hypothetical protein
VPSSHPQQTICSLLTTFLFLEVRSQWPAVDQLPTNCIVALRSPRRRVVVGTVRMRTIILGAMLKVIIIMAVAGHDPYEIYRISNP